MSNRSKLLAMKPVDILACIFKPTVGRLSESSFLNENHDSERTATHLLERFEICLRASYKTGRARLPPSRKAA